MSPLITLIDNLVMIIIKEPIKTQKKRWDLFVMNNQFQKKLSHLTHRALIVHQIHYLSSLTYSSAPQKRLIEFTESFYDTLLSLSMNMSPNPLYSLIPHGFSSLFSSLLNFLVNLLFLSHQPIFPHFHFNCFYHFEMLSA